MIELRKHKELSDEFETVCQVFIDGVSLPRESLKFLDFVKFDHVDEFTVECICDNRLHDYGAFDFESLPYMIRKPEYINGNGTHVGVVKLKFDATKIKRT